MHFIEKIINSYEQQEYMQLLSTKVLKDPIQNLRECLCPTAIDDPALVGLFQNLIYQKLKISWDCHRIFRDFCLEHTITMHFFYTNRVFKHKNWFVQIDMFINRAISVLHELALDRPKSNKIMPSLICYNIGMRPLSQDFSFKAIESIFRHTFLLQGKNPSRICLKPPEKNDLSAVPKEMLKAAKNLTCAQLAGLLVFLQFENINSQEYKQWHNLLQGPMVFP